MIRDLQHVADMSDKEIMYVVASEYIDEICKPVVAQAEEIMSNDIVRAIVCQAAETKLRYEERRKQIIMGEEESDCFYEFLQNDIRAYKTVLYNSLFHKYGANNADV